MKLPVVYQSLASLYLQLNSQPLPRGVARSLFRLDVTAPNIFPHDATSPYRIKNASRNPIIGDIWENVVR